MKYTIILFATIFIMSGCLDEDIVSTYQGDPIAHFLGADAKYDVSAQELPFNISVGLTTPAIEPISYMIEFLPEQSTAEMGRHFTLSSNQLTIQSGEVIGDAIIVGDFEELTTEPVLATFRLSGSGGAEVAGYNNVISVSISQSCDFSIDGFVGTYSFSTSAFDAVISVSAVAGGTNSIVFPSLYEGGKDIEILLDSSTGTATVNKQPAWTHETYGIASVEGVGTFDKCTSTISVELEHTVDAGSFGSFLEVFTKL